MGTSWKRVVPLHVWEGIDDTVKVRNQARSGREKGEQQMDLKMPSGPTSIQCNHIIGLMRVIKKSFLSYFSIL